MLQSEFLSPAFIEKIMQSHAPEKNIRVQQVQALTVDNSASILVALTSGRTDKPIGHFGLAVTYQSDGLVQTQNMVMKLKPHGSEISEMLNFLATACGGALPETYETYKTLTGFQNTHGRELEIYGKMPSGLTPEIYGLYVEENSGTYVILMEYLQEVDLLNTVMQPDAWTDLHIRQALKQIAGWHAEHLEGKPLVNPLYWSDAPSLDYMQQLTPLWEKLLQNASGKFPELFTPDRTIMLEKAIQQIPEYWQELTKMPKTMVHNDLNPRNSCFKTKKGEMTFCVYDWELATYHIPQYDIVEFLCFVLEPARYHLRPLYLEYYRNEMHKLTGRFNDSEYFERGFSLAALDFGIHRLGMYMMAHTVSPYPFLERVVNSYFNTLEQFNPFFIKPSDKGHNAPIHMAAHS